MLFQNLTQYIESLKMLLISAPFSPCLYPRIAVFCSLSELLKYVHWKYIATLGKQIIKRDAFSKTFYRRRRKQPKKRRPLHFCQTFLWVYLQQRELHYTVTHCSLCQKVQYISACLEDMTHSLQALMTR